MMTKTFTPVKNSQKSHTILLSAILLSGIFLRVFHYFDNRSLWEDEVFLASSLIHMDFLQLATLPLEYQQRAPVGFLWLSRLGVVLFGKKELALRLFPFLCGIASLLLFVPVARHFLRSGRSIVAAVFIAAFAPPLVYHAVEVKQYGTEFLATVLCLLLYINHIGKTDVKNLVLWGLGGAAILWFSFSSLFVLAGIGGAVALTCIIRKDWRMFFLYLVPFSLWLFSFVIQYVFFISRFPEEEWLVQFWRNREAFMPFPPRSLHDVLWHFNQIYSLVRYPIGLSWFDLDYEHDYSQVTRILARIPFLPIVVGTVGLATLYFRQKRHLLLFSLPVILALAASSLEFYPLRERLTLFLAPIFILVMAKGVERIDALKISSNAKTWIVAILLAAPLMNSVLQIWNTSLFGSYKKSMQREVMQNIQSQYRENDIVYVYWNDLPSYRYYEEAYNFRFNTIYGSDERKTSSNFNSYLKNMSGDFQKFQGHERLWYIYKPYNGLKLGDIENEPQWYYRNVDAVGKVLGHISKMGTLQEVFPSGKTTDDVKVCLFELSVQ
ncbi:glycosyltransferase family 39 protein [Dyadobacter sediminis]|uniref:Uncharacterized protein n=1 Tax=Dyadobacter sediminis TaxID=1493691 RepID=A0A5R9KFJ3_9BACT|nr:glycosyltransferase family 39 protein [Dyadobacter sediminis]TLU94893.1 hypothetical protein FEM55_11820 [Dyadobacter sediminis]GGB87057.1 hypothetical protein GCM10011325_13280 [Dyadobacter sediminis]